MESSTVPAKVKEDSVAALVRRMKPSFLAALPVQRRDHIERFARVALTTLRKNPKLLECSQASLLGSMMAAAQMGLDIDSALGHAYLIPYKTTCQLILGYKGLVELAYRSDKVVSVSADCVYSNDAFSFEKGLEPKLIHKPKLGDRGKFIAAYAIVHLKNGGVVFEVMDKKQIDAVRDRSRAKSDGPWVTDYDEMGKKTPLRKVMKLLPLSAESARGVAIDERAEAGLPQDIDMEPAEFSVVEPEAKPKEQKADAPPVQHDRVPVEDDESFNFGEPT